MSPSVRSDEAGVLAHQSANDLRARDEHARTAPVVGAAAAVLFHSPAKLRIRHYDHAGSDSSPVSVLMSAPMELESSPSKVACSSAWLACVSNPPCWTW